MDAASPPPRPGPGVPEPGPAPRAAEIAAAVDALRRRIDRAAIAAGRRPETIEIVAASKLRTAEEIAAAHAAGIARFGENRVQEWHAKHAACPATVRWDFIGALQRNKVRHVVGECELIHAVDRESLARAISEAAILRGVRQRILLEVNVSGEASKHGVAPDDAADAARAASQLPGLEVRGLMTVGHPTDPAPGFRLLASLRERLAHVVPAATELSMGMSGDLEEAIAAGATIVRPGTALFGPRPSMP